MINSSDSIPANLAAPSALCPACYASVPSSANFCPNCGKGLKKTPLSTSVPKQVVIYLVSFFLAPLGLWYAWKYLREEDKKSKVIGSAAVALTVVSLALSIWAAASLFNSMIQIVRSFAGAF